MQNSKKQNNKFSSEKEVYSILGLPFDALTQQQAIDAVIFAIEHKQRCFLTTPNLNFLITAQQDDAFYQSVIDSDLNIADGMPIVWIAKLLGIPIKERVAGSDLFAGLSKLKGRDKKISVFFFGGQEGIAARASTQLNASSEGMISCGFHDPGFVSVDEMSSEQVIEKINQANPDFLVVALGAKKGQDWIQKNRHQLNVPIISHLGAVINFVAGHVERAPLFWQRSGFEWLWRIKQEPDLWKRYFFDGLAFVRLLTCKVLPLAIYDRYLKCHVCFEGSLEISLSPASTQIIVLEGSAHHDKLGVVKAFFEDTLKAKDGDIILDCSQLSYIDGAFIGLLLVFQRFLKDQGQQLFLQNVSKRVMRILCFNNVLNRFQFMA